MIVLTYALKVDNDHYVDVALPVTNLALKILLILLTRKPFDSKISLHLSNLSTAPSFTHPL